MKEEVCVCVCTCPRNPLTQTSGLFSSIPVYSSPQDLTSDHLLTLQVFQDAPELVPQPPAC